jgi:predicted RNase H-like HicB family nuclease
MYASQPVNHFSSLPLASVGSQRLGFFGHTGSAPAGLFPRQVWWHDGDMHKAPASGFSLAIEYHREVDGRWLADIPALPGVTAYGRTRKQATAAVQALALRLIANRLEHGEAVSGPMNVSFSAA